MKNPLMSASMNYGGFMGLALIVCSLLVYVLGLEYGGVVNNILFYGIMIGGVIYFGKKYRMDHMGGYLSYGQAFSIGFFVLLFASILSNFYNWIFLSFIDPGVIDLIKEKSYESYISMGMSEDEAVRSLEQAEAFMSPGMISVMGFFGGLVMGAILSAITALFLKKENPNPFADVD